MSKNTVCIYSGGMDSYTLAAYLHAQGRLHSALGFDYGQRHRRELQYACAYCDSIGVPYRVVDLSGVNALLKGSALTDPSVTLPQDVHHEHHAQRLTFVPNRNMLMLSIAIAWAQANALEVVAFGAHGGDREIYPDCRREFVESMSTVARLSGWHPVRVEAPFLDGDKRNILRLGVELNLDYSRAWTCYEGGEVACGRCGSCRERLAAFDAFGLKDPMEYQV